MGARLLALALALGLTLVGAELLLTALGLPSERAQRFLGPLAFDQDLVADDVLFWRLSRDPGRFESNRLGLRGWLPRGPKGASDVRIAVVGDSCTFGSGVGASESYGARLERLLQEQLPAARVEVLLAALPGFTSHQLRLLYTREIAALQPDVTVLYLGAFNDYQPALGPNDAERSALRERPWRRFLGRTRVGRVLAHATDPERGAANRVEVAGHVRVPLDAFRANLQALVESARGAGSEVVILVPPLPAASLEHAPVALEYRAALRALAAERELALLDAPALLAPWSVALPSDWPASSRYWPLYIDSVHPSSFGHELLARALQELLAPAIEAWAERPGSDAARPVLGAVTPERACALAGPEVLLQGSGFAAPEAFDRAFVGAEWILAPRVVDDATLGLTLPRHLAPGRHAITLVTRAGLVRGPRAWIDVEPPALALTGERVGDGFELRGALAGPPGWLVRLWAAPALRAEPARTSAGPFWLPADPDGRLPGIEHGSFVFDRLQLPAAGGAFDADGRWALSVPPYLLSGEQELFLQALFFLDAGRSVLSAPLRLEVPPPEER